MGYECEIRLAVWAESKVLDTIRERIVLQHRRDDDPLHVFVGGTWDADHDDFAMEGGHFWESHARKPEFDMDAIAAFLQEQGAAYYLFEQPEMMGDTPIIVTNLGEEEREAWESSDFYREELPDWKPEEVRRAREAEELAEKRAYVASHCPRIVKLPKGGRLKRELEDFLNGLGQDWLGTVSIGVEAGYGQCLLEFWAAFGVEHSHNVFGVIDMISPEYTKLFLASQKSRVVYSVNGATLRLEALGRSVISFLSGGKPQEIAGQRDEITLLVDLIKIMEDNYWKGISLPE